MGELQKWRLPPPPNAFLESGWLLLAILLPLWVNVWLRQPFELAKVVLVRALVGLLLAAAVILYVRSGALWLPLFSIRRSPIFWPIIALTVLMVLATATAVQPQLSLWGSYERGQGLSTQLAYVSLFLLVVGYLRTLAQARRLVSAIVWPGAFLVAVGLLQAAPVVLDFLPGEAGVAAAGWQLLPLVSDARSPVYGTLGRSNFLGAYLALLLPLTLALLFTGRQRRQRTILSVLLVGQVAVLAMTLARSAWLAALVGVALFALLWQGANLARRWRRSGWIGLAMMALSGPLAVLWLGRLEQGSTAARLAIWQSTLGLIKERPLLGYGPDSLFLVFPRVFPPELVYYQGRHF